MKDDLPVKAKIYLRAAELVEQGHCKGSLAADCRGYPVHDLHMNPTSAVKFCFHGAQIRATFEICGQREGIEAYWKYHEGYPHMSQAVRFNDRYSTTPAMVAAKLREEAFK